MNHKTSQRIKWLGLRICLVLALVMCFSLFIFGAGEDPQPTEAVKKADETQLKKEEPKKEVEKKCTGDLMIVYDFLNDNPDSLFNCRLDVKYRQNVIFKVINVNPFLFKVDIKGQPFEYFEEEYPTEFIPEKSETKPEDVAADVSEKVIKKVPKSLKKNNMTSVNDWEAAYKKYRDYFFSSVDKRGSWNEIRSEEDDKFSDLRTYLSLSSKDGSIDYFEKLRGYNQSIMEFINLYEKTAHISEFHNSLGQLFLRNESFGTIKSKAKKLLGEIWPDEKLKIDFCTTNFSSWIEKTVQQYDAINFTDFKEVEEGLKSFRKNLDKMKQEKIIESIDNMLQNFQEKNFERSLCIPTVDADELQFDVKIEPIDKAKTTVHKEICGPIHVRVRGGWAINFSTGMIFNFDPIAHHYLLQTQTTEQGKAEIIDDRKLSIYPSVVGLMHIYPRFAGSFGWGGITFGISAKDTEQITYLLGTSLLLGNSNKRFIISGGLALFKTDVLKPGYEVGQVLLQDASLKAENLVTKEFKVKFFLGFTYNLTKPKTK